MTDGGTVIDGTTQTANRGDTNLGVFTTGFLGAGGTVGLGADERAATGDEPALSRVAAPEIEITNGSSIRTGLDVQANSVTIRGIAIYGFGQNLDADIDGDIRVGLDGTTDFTGTLIEQNVVGATAYDFASPPLQTDGDGIIVRGADSGTVRNNLIGFVYRSGIKTHDDALGWLIEGNEMRGNGTTTRYGDAVDLGWDTGTTTISRNLLIDNGASGVDSYESLGSNTLDDNTVTGNGFAGQASQETSGIRLFGADSEVTRNLIQGNFGAGVLVVGDGTALNQPALRNRIARNAFSGNGSNAIDLLAGGGDRNFGDGITINGGSAEACSYLASTGNEGLEYPVISSAVLSGATTTIVGQACPNSEIEVYRAAVGVGDTSGGADYGEGERYVGSTTTNGSGDFTLITSGFSLGEVATAIVIDSSDNTSEFGPTAQVTATISGTIFEDIVGDALADGAIGSAANPIEPGVRVELYRDGGDGEPDGDDDVYQGFVISSAVDGAYSFTVVTNGVYWVVVDSQGVDESPYNTGYSGSDTWYEQTYGPLGAASFNGVSWSFAGSAGPLYGGARWAVSDDFTPTDSLPAAEHIARVEIAGTTVSDVDFGFSCNVVTTTRGGDSVKDAGAGAGQRTVQGSLRQFLTNAAAQDRPNTMRFVPAAPTNANDGGGSNWWRIDVVSQLPSMTDAATTIDGTAYDFADGTSPRNTNPVVLGTGGTVGVENLMLDQVAGPELEIRDGAGLDYGLRVEDNDAFIRAVSIWGFGTGDTGEGTIILVNDVLDARIEGNVIGSGPASFEDPGAGSRSWENIYSGGADDGTIRNNLIGFGGTRGILLAVTSENWTIENNELRDNSLDDPFGDGLAIDPGSADVTGNRIVGSGSQGVVVKGSTGCTFTNNTISGNGIGTDTTSGNAAGMTFRSTATAMTVDRNVITANYGAGISVNDGSTGNKITRNSLAGNGTIVARNGDPATGQIGIDLNESGDDASAGTFPFFTLNDSGDTDSGGNDLLNYPVLDTATKSGANMELTGWAGPNSIIEVYVSDGDPTGFGEGQTWAITLTEGGTGSGGDDPYADLDASSSSYGPGAINGTVQGEDTTNRFRFEFPIPAGVVAGTRLTATARDGAGNTSEFGGFVTAQLPLSIVKRAFQMDGTPIASGSRVPRGSRVKFMLYVNNLGGDIADATLQDALDPSFVYQASSMKMDHTLLSNVVCPGGVCDEAAIFSQVDGSGIALGDGDTMNPPNDADVGSYSPGTKTIDLGDGNNTNNIQLDLTAGRVWAVVFTSRMQ